MNGNRWDRHRDFFSKTLSDIESPSGLFYSALAISAIQYPEIEEEQFAYIQNTISDLAQQFPLDEESKAELSRESLSRFTNFFSHTLGFHGNRDDYGSPDNSCLNKVIESRRGLPITLSLLMVAIGEKVGIDLYGVGAPGNFLVGVKLDNTPHFINPFDGPEVLDESAAIERIAVMTGSTSGQIAPLMNAAEPIDILKRMLNNLKGTYARMGDVERLIECMSWALEVDSESLDDLRNRGLLYLRLGLTGEGANDLLKYVRQSPEDTDLAIVAAEAFRARNKLESEE